MNRSHADAKLHGKISKGIKTPPANCCINCSPSLCGIQSWAHPSVRGRTSITKNHDSFCRDSEIYRRYEICKKTFSYTEWIHIKKLPVYLQAAHFAIQARTETFTRMGKCSVRNMRQKVRSFEYRVMACPSALTTNPIRKVPVPISSE